MKASALWYLPMYCFRKYSARGGDVLGPFPKRRDAHRGHVEPIVQVATKGAGLYAFGQVAIGGRDDTHVHLAGRRGAHPHDFPVLQNPQKTGLHGQGQLSHFIQKDGAAISDFKIARLAPAGSAGKGAGIVAEQLGFGQRFRNAAAVHLEHDLAFAQAQTVGQAGEHVLARTGFPKNQHSGVGGGETLQERHDSAHGLTGENQRVGFVFLGHVGQLIIDLLNELALPVQPFLEIGQTGDVPGKGEHQANGARLIKDRKARQHQFLSVTELLHTGGGFAGPNDFRVEDVIKNTFLDQGTHVLAHHTLLLQAGQLLVHPVDVEGHAGNVGNEQPIGQGVEDALDISGENFVGASHGDMKKIGYILQGLRQKLPPNGWAGLLLPIHYIDWARRWQCRPLAPRFCVLRQKCRRSRQSGFRSARL